MKKCLKIKIINLKSNSCSNLYSNFNFSYNKSYSNYYLIYNTYKKNFYGIKTKYSSTKISFETQNSQQSISPESSNNSNSNKKISKMSEGVKRLLQEENLENEINNINNTDTSDRNPKMNKNEYNTDTYNKYSSNNKDSSNSNNEFEDIVLDTENISDICLTFTTIKQYQQFFIAKYKSLVYDTPLLLLFYDYYITFLNAQIQNNSLSISEKIQLEEDSKSKAIKSNFLSNIKVKSDVDYKTAYLYYEEDVIERTDLINCSNTNIREILDIRNDIIIKTISIMMNYKITETNLDPFLLISFIESTTKAFHYNAFQDTYDDENISKYDDITEIDKFNLDNISNSGNKDISGNNNNDSSLLNAINNFSSSLNIKDKLLNAAGLNDKTDNKHVKTKMNRQRIKTKNIYNQIMLKFQYLILRTHFLKNIEYKYFPIILRAFENFFKEDSQTTVDPEEVFEKLEYEILLYLNERHNVYLSEYDSINSSNISNNSNSINNNNSNKKHNNLVKLTSFKDFLLQQNNTSLLFLFKDNIIESFILIAKNLEGSLEFYEAIIYMLHANINLIFTKSFDVNASKSIPDELSDLSININGSNDVNNINNPIISEYYNANIYDVSEVETKNSTSKRITVINKNLFIEIYYCLVLVSDNVCSNSKVINSLLNKMEDILNEHSKKVYYYLSELVISDEDEFNDYSERVMNKNKFPLLLYNKEVTVDMLKWALNKREKFLLENKFASM